MKKFLIPILVLLLSFSLNSGKAQTAVKKPPTIKTATKTKKDGTPDMRYKENKKGIAKEEPKHLKKDGTPDKRYSENEKK
ncbi:MAG: hypothetical protein QM530_04030 [Phycisphaerales bacterium]|nr:hypothetical protein [Phycisphaerales bacterium]